MTYDDDDEGTLFTTYTVEFSMVRVINSVVVPSRFTLTAGINIIEGDDVANAMAKIEHFFDDVVSPCIAMSSENAAATSAFIADGKARFVNPLMITPRDPSDAHLCAIFQAKIEALAGDAFSVGTIDVCADTSRGLAFAYTGVWEDYLPTMEEWLGGKPSWFDVPWWNRDDASTLDSIKPEGADPAIKPSWAYDIDQYLNLTPSSYSIIDMDFDVIDGGGEE